jgi:hypothetical protein
MYVSAPYQLQQVSGNADGGASKRLVYDSCLQGIYAKQIIAGDMYENTTQQWCLQQWEGRLNRQSQTQ